MPEKPRRAPVLGARQRILAAATELLARRGVRGVGVDEILRASGTAKASFYTHFRSKDEVVLACLEQCHRERAAAMDAALAGCPPGSAAAVLAVFDVFEDWFRQGDVQVGAFLRVMMEMGPEHPLGRAGRRYLELTRRQVADLAGAAGMEDPEGVAWSLEVLIQGAIVAHAGGDPHAADRARRMGALLMEGRLRP